MIIGGVIVGAVLLLGYSLTKEKNDKTVSGSSDEDRPGKKLPKSIEDKLKSGKTPIFGGGKKPPLSSLRFKLRDTGYPTIFVKKPSGMFEVTTIPESQIPFSLTGKKIEVSTEKYFETSVKKQDGRSVWVHDIALVKI